jgi:hypothetical protein
MNSLKFTQCPVLFLPPRDFATNDGTSRMLQLAQEMEEVFPTYDLSGHKVTPIHSHHRMLSCGTTFVAPDCIGSCSCTGKVELSKCKARQLKCKGNSVQGLKFPFSKYIASISSAI